MTDDLERDLAALADRVRPVDVTPRARRTARRLRIAVAATAALVVTVGGVAAASAFVGGDDGASTAAGSPTGPGADSIDGTFYGLTGPNAPRSAYTLSTWRPGDDEPTTLVPSDESWFGSVAALSPDGAFVADVFDAGSGAIRSPGGMAIDGSGAETSMIVRSIEDAEADETVLRLPGIDFWDMCSVPTWSPDSSRLYIDRGGDDGFGYIAAADIGGDGPRFTPVDRPDGCQIRVATDGAGNDVFFSIDRVDGRVELVRTDADGTSAVTPVGGTLTDAGLTLRGLTAVSTDGRMACLSTNYVAAPVDIAGHWELCHTIVDTQTGAIVELPVDQYGENSGWIGGAGTFAEPNRLLVHATFGANASDDDYADVWHLYDYEGNLIDAIDTRCGRGVVGDCTGGPHLGYLPRTR